MKAKTLLLFISFVSAPAAYSFGQVDCSTSTKLVCQYPVSATILATTTFGPNSSEVAVARGPSLTTASTINSAIAAQLTQLPIPSASIGIVTLKEKGSDVGVPFDNLGPILTDRPDTVGKGHLFVGFSYQHFNFNSIDGVSLGSLSSTFSFSQPSPSNASATQTFYASASNNVGFTLDQFVGIATYGIGRTTDLSVVVPFNSVNLNVTSSNFQVFEYDSALKTYANESPAAGTAASTSGAASLARPRRAARCMSENGAIGVPVASVTRRVSVIRAAAVGKSPRQMAAVASASRLIGS